MIFQSLSSVMGFIIGNKYLIYAIFKDYLVVSNTKKGLFNKTSISYFISF
jgi:hypothetical protein